MAKYLTIYFKGKDQSSSNYFVYFLPVSFPGIVTPKSDVLGRYIAVLMGGNRGTVSICSSIDQLLRWVGVVLARPNSVIKDKLFVGAKQITNKTNRQMEKQPARQAKRQKTWDKISYIPYQQFFDIRTVKVKTVKIWDVKAISMILIYDENSQYLRT